MTHRKRRRRAPRDVRTIVVGALGAVIVTIAIALVVVNQQTVGWANLGLMSLGLTLLVVMLALYNRRYR